MSRVLLLRRRFSIADRVFTVLGEPCFDRAAGEWSALLIFVPLDRSLARSVAWEGPLRGRGGGRDEVVRKLSAVSDRALVRVFRSIVLPLPRRARVG